MSQAIITSYISITSFAAISQFEEDHSMIETRRLKNAVIFSQKFLIIRDEFDQRKTTRLAHIDDTINKLFVSQTLIDYQHKNCDEEHFLELLQKLLHFPELA